MMLALSPLAIEPVERLFIQAVEIAEKQGARTWHLRSVVSWARLLSSSGRTREARNQLSALYSTFREGMGSPDLLSARTLLEELAEGPSPRGLEQSSAGYHFW
jgi:predicted ATPase